jgi:hypothetical protein
MEHALSLLDALALEHGVAEIALPAPAHDPEEPAPKFKKTSKAPNKARPKPSAKPSEILQPTSKSTPLHSPLVVECTLTLTPSFDSEDELPEPVVKMHKLSVPPWRNSSPPTACRPPVSCPKPIGAPVDLRPSVAPSRPSSSSRPIGSKAAPIGAPMLPPEDRPVPLLPPRSLGPTQPARPPPATMLPISHTLRVIGAASPQTKHLVVPKHVAAVATTDVFAAAFGDGFLLTPHLLRPKAAIVPPPSQAKSWCEGAAAVSRPPPPPPAVSRPPPAVSRPPPPAAVSRPPPPAIRPQPWAANAASSHASWTAWNSFHSRGDRDRDYTRNAGVRRGGTCPHWQYWKLQAQEEGIEAERLFLLRYEKPANRNEDEVFKLAYMAEHYNA